MKTNGLQNAVSPQKLAGQPELPFMDTLLRDITAINDFLVGVEAKPFLMHESAKDKKWVAFKNTKES